jgi:sugar phosphate isomerase/epimerase
MKQPNRRNFLRQATVLTAAATFLPGTMRGGISFSPAKRAFKMCLNPFSIGVQVNQQELLRLAAEHGFEAIIAIPQQLADMESGEVKDLVVDMEQMNISWGAAGLPVQFRQSEQKFREDLEALPRLAGALQRAGVTRTNTWIMPTHAELTYLENFELHRSRLQQVANVLGHYGVKLGLEYVGPKTLMARDKFAFIRTMKEAKELIHAIGEPNVGFVLDSFHWFCAGESAADILTLDANDIVTCDLNDARAGIPADEQIDGKRELPTATGVIDLKGYLGALVQTGYDGPVRAEPFNAPLNEMDNEAAVKATQAAMKKAFELVS